MCNQSQAIAILGEGYTLCNPIFGNAISDAYLYGSYAREDYHAESDIDIMILLDCPKEKMKEYRDLFLDESSRIGLEYDVLVAVLLRDKEDFADKISYYPFYQNVEREGVELYERAA